MRIRHSERSEESVFEAAISSIYCQTQILRSLPKARPYPMPRTGGGMGTLAARIYPPSERRLARLVAIETQDPTLSTDCTTPAGPRTRARPKQAKYRARSSA